MDLTTNVTRITDACLKYGLVLNNTMQTVNGFTLFPKDYFCPKSQVNYKTYLTKNSCAIHHFNSSWYTPKQKLKKKVKKFFNLITFGLFGKLYLKLRKDK